jgi:exonuclease III
MQVKKANLKKKVVLLNATCGVCDTILNISLTCRVLWSFLMDPSHILIWNVWGLNAMTRQDAVWMLVNVAKVDIVCLQETKMAEVSRRLILSMLGSDFDNNSIFLPSVGASGGVLIAWRAALGMVGASRLDAYCASVQFCPENGEAWWLTCVYGPHGNEDKLSFLQELRTL